MAASIAAQMRSYVAGSTAAARTGAHCRIRAIVPLKLNPNSGDTILNYSRAESSGDTIPSSAAGVVGVAPLGGEPGTINAPGRRGRRRAGRDRVVETGDTQREARGMSPAMRFGFARRKTVPSQMAWAK